MMVKKKKTVLFLQRSIRPVMHAGGYNVLQLHVTRVRQNIFYEEKKFCYANSPGR